MNIGPCKARTTFEKNEKIIKRPRLSDQPSIKKLTEQFVIVAIIRSFL